MKKLTIIFSLIVSSNLSYTQELIESYKDSLDTFFKALSANEKFMGQVEVYHNGKVKYQNHVGFSNLEASLRTGRTAKYRIGSISKTLTATLVLKAVEEGKIDLSQNIESFFPDIKNAEIITIEQLLNHHSGVANFTGNESFKKWYTSPRTASEMIAIISSAENDFQPGEKAVYSNSNYVLLSYILERTYQKNYADILNKKIIEPLTLKHTQYGDKSIPEKARTYSYSYEVEWKREPMTDESIPMGAGGIVMSAQDLSIYLNALFNGKIISKQLLNTMLIQKEGFGMGIFKTNILGKEAYTHDGKIDGFNSVFYYFPEERLTYVLLSNGKNYQLTKINSLVLKAVFNKAFEVPKINPFKLRALDLENYLGVYKSHDSPLIITISRNGNSLLAQPKGQRVFTMDAMAKDAFSHDESGVTLEFNTSEKSMTMKQGEQIIHFFQ